MHHVEGVAARDPPGGVEQWLDVPATPANVPVAQQRFDVFVRAHVEAQDQAVALRNGLEQPDSLFGIDDGLGRSRQVGQEQPARSLIALVDEPTHELARRGRQRLETGGDVLTRKTLLLR